MIFDIVRRVGGSLVGTLALGALAIASPAHSQAQDQAQTQAQAKPRPASAPANATLAASLECVMDATTPGVFQRIADVVTPDNGVDDMGAPRMEEMLGAVNACAKKNGLPQAQVETLGLVYLSRLIRLEGARQLAERGIPTEAVHRALDVGEGRRNMQPFSVTDDQVQDLLTLLDAAGVNLDTIDQSTFRIIGLYAAAVAHEYSVFAARK